MGVAATMVSDEPRGEDGVAVTSAGTPVKPTTGKVARPTAQAESILHSTRFHVRRSLGAGAFGTVYEAYDNARRSTIALKTLRLADPRRLYSLKQEFRKLADISHPNLVNLYELGVEDGAWYIAMELVDGVEFMDWVRPKRHPEDDHPPVDYDRLRESLRGLVTGVQALHGKGIKHSDLKPSNVLVDTSGRVVILDFGLVSLQDPQMGGAVTGTPHFMSPEQAMGDLDLTYASDWYAVGTILYLALTNSLPYDGPLLSLLLQKSSRDPTPVGELNPEAPEDLVALCTALMAREPEDRPTGDALLEQLGLSSVAAEASGAMDTDDEGFVGREKELAALHKAARRVRRGQSAVAFVSGPSGIGKSVLVRRFLRELGQHQSDTITLWGRCLAQESVPYKGLDGVIDALHGALLRLQRDERAAILPVDLPILARAFPVLTDLRPGEGFDGIQDEQELKLRVMRVLRDLFKRLAGARPVVVVIDDLQWADPDSVVLLSELLRPPEAPAILVVGLYRSEDAESSVVLRELREHAHFQASSDGVLDLPVGALPVDASRALLDELITTLQLHTIDEKTAELILEESGGEPFLIQEYARFAAAGMRFERHDKQERRAALDGLLAARMERLPVEARELLDVVAVAGVPIARDVATRAAGSGANASKALKVLRSHSLIRRLGAPLEDHVEAYHDRIREVAVKHVPTERLGAIHADLGQLLEQQGADAETLMVHFAGAHKHDRATQYALQAAQNAGDALAFDRAAALYERAVELGELAEGTQQLDIRVALGDAYRNAGRSALAARAYLGAARYANGIEAQLKLKSRASGQYFQCGRTDDGMEIASEVLEAVGEHMPQSRVSAMLRLLALRGRLRMRGLKYTERAESEVPERDLLRMDMCYEVSTTFNTFDEIIGSVFGCRLLLQALDAGEPRRLSLALGIEACYAAVTGGADSRRVAELLEMSEDLAAKIDDPFVTASTKIVRAVVYWGGGDFGRALPLATEALKEFTEDCIGVPWDRAVARFFMVYSQRWSGHYGELVRHVPDYLAEAEAVGDQYTQLYLRGLFLPYTYLVQDRPQDIEAELVAALALRPRKQFEVQNWWAMSMRANRLLYERDGAAAYELVCETWGKMKWALLLSVVTVNAEALALRARTAIAAALGEDTPGGRKKRLREAVKTASKVAKLGGKWNNAVAKMLSAGISAAQGQPSDALLEEAEQAFIAANNQVYAAVCRRQRGVLMGGTEGDALVADADAALRNESVAVPEKYAQMVLPVTLGAAETPLLTAPV